MRSPSRAVLVLAGIALTAGTLAAPASADLTPGSPRSGPLTGGTVISGDLPDVPPVRVGELSAGGDHSLAVAADGRTYAWGDNRSGQLGNGSFSPASTPTAVSLPQDVTFTTVSAGAEHSLAIGSDGRTYAWGAGGDGQLGNDSTAASPRPTDVRAPFGVTFRQISAGGFHSLAIGSDGRTYAWGSGASGRLGNGSGDGSSVPIEVTQPSGATFTAVSAGVDHSVAIGSDGRLYAWGSGADGQLGDGRRTTSSTPVQVTTPAGVTYTEVSAGESHTLAIGSDGRTYAWGDGSSGRLGNNGFADAATPVAVSLPAGVSFIEVSAGADHNLATGSDGRTYAWGGGSRGQLGNNGTTGSAIPVVVSQPNGVRLTEISAGLGHSLANGSDGRAYAWGDGRLGQLGNGGTADASVPASVSLPAGPDRAVVTAVTVGGLATTNLSQNTSTWSATTTASEQCRSAVDVVVSYTVGDDPTVRTETIAGSFSYVGRAPTISGQPLSSSIDQGQDFLTEVVASGSPTPSVQWQSAVGDSTTFTDVQGATQSLLRARPNETTRYRAVLTNCAGTATSATATATVTRRITVTTITATSGGGQSTETQTAFGQPLVATVTDTSANGAPVPAATVTYTVTAGSATFSGNASSATVATDSDGRATSPTLIAGSSAGSITVTASTPGVETQATFTLSATAVQPPAPVGVTFEQAQAACAPGGAVPQGYTLRQGTAAKETLRGTEGDDVIRGLGGNDTLFGLGGNDILCGGAGNDSIQGGDGADFVFGEDGNDSLQGQAGDDVIAGGLGNDSLLGGAGVDTGLDTQGTNTFSSIESRTLATTRAG